MEDKANRVHGYKAFYSNWTGNFKQYTCPGKFEQKEEPKLGWEGMHFCRRLIDCFNHYDFHPLTRIAEVVAYGKMVYDEDSDEWEEAATDKLEIIREIPWSEVLERCNTAKGNTGKSNTGRNNSGHYNAGTYNRGRYNTGHYNVGNYNTGNYNWGHHNTGNRNMGIQNVGDTNGGHYNTGDANDGNYNSGSYNSGDCNSGWMNSGTQNSGSWNSGNQNVGDWNSGNLNVGCFMTLKENRIPLFNKPSRWTYQNWEESEACKILKGAPVKVEDRQEWWNVLDCSERYEVMSLPNFDADIFYECTGIRINKEKEEF